MLIHKIISYVFHPIIFSIIATLIYFILLPSHISKQSEYSILIIVFISTYLVPLLMLLFLKRLNMIENFQLRSIDERKFPTLFMIVLFILLGRLLLVTSIVPLLAYSFFACSLALCFVYILFYMKIKASLHALSIAGLIGFICVISYKYQLNLLSLIIPLFLLFGLISMSRLKLKAHESSEIYLGFLIGFMSQIVGYYILSGYNI